MNTLQRLLCVGAGIFTLSLAGCGGSAGEEETSTQRRAPSSEPSVPKTRDYFGKITRSRRYLICTVYYFFVPNIS